jgi:hypothetical protein
MFIDLLKDATESWDVRIAAYCLMANHYHLLIHTPKGNLSRCMRHINGVYTQRFNRSHGLNGQLFRGRFKSILVDGEDHLLELVRYIHSVAIYLVRMLRRDGLLDISSEFGLRGYSSASSVLDGVRKKIRKNRQFRKGLERIKRSAIIGQTETPFSF